MMNPNWKSRSLGELFEIGAGKTMSAAARAGIEKVPFLRTSNVLWDEIDLSTVDEMSMSAQELAEKSLKPGDLLVCEGGDIGRAAVWDGQVDIMSFQNHLHRLRPLSPDVEPRFYAYFLQSAFTQLGIFEGEGNKTTIPNLSRNRLAAFDVPYPPLDEQQAVVRSLAELRRAIKLHDKATATAMELKASAMRELFTRGLRGEPQKETEVGLMPESWTVERVGDQATMISKGASPKWQGFDYVSSGVLFVRSQNVGNGVMEWRDKAYLSPEWNKKERRSILRAGDVLINLVGASIGRSAVGGPEVEGANCNQAVCFVRLDENEVDPGFLNGFLQTSEGQKQIHGSKKDIARANLSLEDVRQILTPKPSLEEQRDIVAVLNALDKKIELHKLKRALLEELFKALLHKLMTGDISVSDLDFSVLPATLIQERAAA
ncbi:restriction endonuclease subunit S [Burkholderia pseudomallei]